MQILLDELNKITELIKSSENSSEADKKEALKEIDSVTSPLLWNDYEALDRISFVFHPENIIRKVAEENDWYYDYNNSVERIFSVLGEMRCEMKKNPSDFNNVKDGKYSDGDSYATCPGRLSVSKEQWNDIKKFYKLGFIQKILLHFWRARVKEHICYGATDPAMVMSVNPLLIAAYAEDMDAVVMLEFPDGYAAKYNLKKYDRLITVNTYRYKLEYTDKVAEDIFCGKNYTEDFIDFYPLIGEFLSKDVQKMESYIKDIPESLWGYVKQLGEDYLKNHKDLKRDGFGFFE